MESFLGNFSPGFCARCFLVKYKKSERTLIITIKYILLYEFEWYLFKIHFLHLKVGSEFLCGWQLANKEWETSGRVWLSSDHVWVRSGLPQNIPKIPHNCLNLSLNYPSWQHDRLIILTKHFIFRYSKTGHLSLLKKMVALLTPFPLLLVDSGPYHLSLSDMAPCLDSEVWKFQNIECLVGLAQTWQTYKKIWLGFGWDLVQGLLRYFQYPSPTFIPQSAHLAGFRHKKVNQLFWLIFYHTYSGSADKDGLSRKHI